MEISEKAIDVLNELIKLNNDRVAGFEKAGTDLEEDDNGLITVFQKLAGESQQYVTELTAIAQQYGGEAAEGTSTTGDLHRAWIDIKSTFTGGGLLAILNECERGEDAIKQAYRNALDADNELGPEITDVLQRQQQGVTEGHDLIRSLRDQAESTGDRTDDQDPVTSGTADPATTGFAPEPSFEGAAGEYDQT